LQVVASRIESGSFIMTIGSLTPLQQTTPLNECLSINDVRIIVAKQLGVGIEFVTSETHFINDLGADFLDRVELMLAIEDHFAGVEITDDDIEQIQVVGDLIRHLNTKR
jgi:acyl carrier protein